MRKFTTVVCWVSCLPFFLGLPCVAFAQSASPIDEARAVVLVAQASAVLPTDAPLALDASVAAVRQSLDAVLDGGVVLSARTSARLQLAAASIDIASMEAWSDEAQPARVVVRAPAEPAYAERSIIRARVEVAPQEVDAPVPARTLVYTEPEQAAPVVLAATTTGSRETWREPVATPRLTSHFGPRVDPITGEAGRMHRGVDYGADTGTPVLATASGRVVLGGYCDRGTGNCVVIDHEGGWRSQYFHLSHVDVRPGQMVRQGEVVGQVGSTGRSTGPHLHFQIGRGSEAVDPEVMFGAAVE